MESFRIQYTCSECKSGNEILVPHNLDSDNFFDLCHVCQHQQQLHFKPENKNGILHQCVVCEKKDFYQQKDFNRKVGVVLFVIAAILCFWTYGISLIILYLIDLFLFSRLGNVVICYKCQTNYRGVKNIAEISFFNHEMNDRIIYSGHDFQGKKLEH